jgi:hypothetical protein
MRTLETKTNLLGIRQACGHIYLLVNPIIGSIGWKKVLAPLVGQVHPESAGNMDWPLGQLKKLITELSKGTADRRSGE